MASREDIERVLKAAKARGKKAASGKQSRSSRDSNGRVGQSMCVIGSRSGFSKRPGRPYREREVEEACGPDAPSLEEANAIASDARWGSRPSAPAVSSRARIKAPAGATTPRAPESEPVSTAPRSGPQGPPESRALASILDGLCEEGPPAGDEGDCSPEQAGRVLGRLLAKHRGSRDRRAPPKKTRKKTPREESVSPQRVMSLRKGDFVELHAKGLSRSPRKLTITGPVDTETGKALGIVYVRTSSGHVRSGHRAGGMLTLRGETLRYQPTMLQAEVDVDAMSVLERAPEPTRSAETPANPPSEPRQTPQATDSPRMREALRVQLRHHDRTWGEARAKTRAWLDDWAGKFPWAREIIEAHFRGRIPTEEEAQVEAEREAEANEATIARAEGAMGRGKPPAPVSSAGRPAAPQSARVMVGIDVLLADLKDGARDSGGRVERKHVAKALRQMLHARHRGFSVQTDRGARSSTLRVVPARGVKRFTTAHRRALLDLFDDDAGRSDSLTILVSRFIGDANSKATGIRAEHADDFRRGVAAAAGLPTPAPFSVEPPSPPQPKGLDPQKAPAPFSVVDLPPDEAANSRPTAAERGRRKGLRAVAESPAPAPVPKPAVCKAPAPEAEPLQASPVRMDHVLRDLKDAAQAKGGYVERKHVAKALRVMLQARRRGFSITTPQHSFATSIDVDSGKGRSSFSPEQNDALREVFGEDAGRRNSFVILVSPFVNDSSSVPTGIRPERIDEFRRLVAKAAGLPKPEPFSALSRDGANKTPAVAASDRMSDEDVQTLLTAFVRYANHHQETAEALEVHFVGKTFQVQAEGGPVEFAVLANPSGFTVLFGEERRLGELFLNTFALPMRGDEKASTERSRIFSWAPKAERGARWAKTMSDFSLPVVKTGERLGIGRDDHEQRRDARADRLRERAAKARGEAHTRFEASKDVPPLGEPIKIGHHSEKRHRKMIERAQSNARKSFEASKKADRLDTRADAAEANTAISSDDPEALARLKAELAAMEVKREAIKTKNRLARAGRLPDAENPENPAAIRSIAGARRYPMPGYALRNLGANIRRVQQRIEQLSMREGRAARSYERGGVRVVENGDLNRLQVFTDGKPPQENRTWLKRSGFRWARSEGAWQRQIGDGAWNLAMQYLDTFVEKDEDTPYARVEAPPPKPTHTDADIEFWREEFALLDAEFPGKDFEAPTHAKVIEALRARKSGHPEMQASAYGEVRTGRRTLEDAVKRMYRYNRHARPKPRPKRPRKAAVSSMGHDAFIAAVKERGAELGGQLFASVSRTGVYFNHYNVPKDVTDGARRENNRLMLSVDGWERDGSPPKDGKVKLEVMVATRLPGLRGRTSTPEAMVDVVAQMFRRNSALESR